MITDPDKFSTVTKLDSGSKETLHNSQIDLHNSHVFDPWLNMQLTKDNP